MKEHNNELSKFIKNRLAADVETNDDWDKPDASVWENAQAQLTPPQKDRKRAIPFWFYGLALGFLLVASLFYNWHLVQWQKETQKQMNEQTKVIAQLQHQASANLEKQQIQAAQNSSTIEKLQLANSELVQENKQLNTECQQIQQRYQTLLSTPTELNDVPELVKSNESISAFDPLIETSNTSKKEVFEVANELPFLALNPIVAAADLAEMRFPTRLVNQPRESFELGLNYGVSMLRLPSMVEFKGDKKTLEKTNQLVAPMYQLHVGYALNKNWWLKTGLHYARYSHKNDVQFKTEYDKSKEFTKPDGTVVNEFQIQTNTAAFRSSQDIQIDIPDDVDLKTGDFIFGTFDEKQRVQLWQIPLGIVYRQQNRRLGWQVEGGMLLNQMIFSDTEFEGKIQSTQNEFSTKIISKVQDSSSSQLLLGTQVGIGANYQLYQNLTLKTGALFQFNPHFFNQNINMGLSFQF